MKEISKSKYIYLNDNGTLLFYGNEKNKDLDKPNLEIRGADEPFVELTKELLSLTPGELERKCINWIKENGSIPEVVQAIIYNITN